MIWHVRGIMRMAKVQLRDEFLESIRIILVRASRIEVGGHEPCGRMSEKEMEEPLAIPFLFRNTADLVGNIHNLPLLRGAYLYLLHTRNRCKNR